MDQSKKLILSIVLLVLAGGLFYWYFKPSAPVQTEEVEQRFKDTQQAKALQNIFDKVGSKKWNNASLWSSAEAAKKFGGDAEKYFTATPSMDKVKILGCRTNKDNNEAPIIDLEVPAVPNAMITIEFKAPDPAPEKWVIDSITVKN